jgi:hypothetical protein
LFPYKEWATLIKRFLLHKGYLFGRSSFIALGNEHFTFWLKTLPHSHPSSNPERLPTVQSGYVAGLFGFGHAEEGHMGEGVFERQCRSDQPRRDV